MTAAPPSSAARAAWLLVRLRGRRVRNRLLARPRKKVGADGGRLGTASRGRSAWIGVLLGVYLPFMAFRFSKTILEVFRRHELHALRGASAPALAAAVRSVAAAELAILLVAALLGSLATRELSAPEWDLEWLVTLPVPRRTLLGLRILERAVVNPPALVLLFPFAISIASSGGRGLVGATLLGLACALPLFALLAAAWVVAETILRMRLSQPRLRNAQALVTILTFVIFFLALSPTNGSVDTVYHLAHACSAVSPWTPPGLAVRALGATSATSVMGALAGLTLEVALAIALALALVERLLRHGVVADGGREAGGRGPLPAGVAAPPAPRPAPWLASLVAWLSPIQRRELRLLARDRNFLVQTLLMPILIVGMQVLFGSRHLSLQHRDPGGVMAAAFGVAAYALMFSAFQTLNSEGQSLWLLFTLPRRLEQILREKAALWTGVALLYPVAITGVLLKVSGPSLRLAGLATVAIAGVPVFALIASAFGVMAWDSTTAIAQQRRLRPAFVYLYMALAGIYAYALVTRGVRERAILVLLTGFVALALWQKARDYLPYVLDSTAAPPARVSIADGLIAAFVFFVAQAVIAALSAGEGSAPSVGLVYKAFIWGGALTFGCVRVVHWRTRATGVPRFFGPRPGRVVAIGLGGALVAGLAGVTYLALLKRWGALPPTPPDALAGAWSLLPLAVIAAPIFEEYIFRGLLFGGLARSTSGPVAALAAALIFAMVHPPLAAVPVFLMALVATAAYARTGFLLAPVLVHAGYNAAILIAQTMVMK